MTDADRTGVTPIDLHLETVRRRLRRVTHHELPGILSSGGILVDIRPLNHREEEGAHPHALVIDRNVLEWRLDPSSPQRVVELEAHTRIVIMCNDGYASSLAAVGLLDMGFTGATDLVGGYRGWLAASP